MRLKVEDNDVLRAVADLTTSQGYPPTFRQLADQVGLTSTSSIFHRVAGLRTQGLIEPTIHSADELSSVKTRDLRLSDAGWTQIGRPRESQRYLGRHFQRVPVFRTSAALNRYLEDTIHRETVPASYLLSPDAVQILPIAEIRRVPIRAKEGLG